MKTYPLLIAIFLGFLVTVNFAANAETASIPPAVNSSITLLGFDANGNRVVSPEDILTGKDKFIVRVATQGEIKQHLNGLLLASDNRYYMPVVPNDFQQADVDANGALTAGEMRKLGIRLAKIAAGQFVLNTLDEDGFSYIRLNNVDTGAIVMLVPKIGSTPIKTQQVQLTKY